MRNNSEYIVCKQIATYLRYQYPKILFHWDLAGLNLSRAQAGMMKAIQGQRGYPDLFIIESRGEYHGLFLEIKKEGFKLTKRNDEYVNDHVTEQSFYLHNLEMRGYKAFFVCGFEEAVKIIKEYLR
jgi:hypothetical protein